MVTGIALCLCLLQCRTMFKPCWKANGAISPVTFRKVWQWMAIARVFSAWPKCLASTTFTHQRQLFLPISDNYTLGKALLFS